jgi:hypothetical protein
VNNITHEASRHLKNEKREYLKDENQGLKQGDASLPLLVNFALEYAISKVQETGESETEWNTSASGLC